MSTRDLVRMAVYLAMFAVLDYISLMFGLFRMPQGGSLGLGVVALSLASYDLGWKKGVFVGIASILVQLMISNFFFISWFQFFLDYVLAFGIYGISIWIPSTQLKPIVLPWGVLVVNGIRLFAHTLSGVLFFEVNWLGSFLYNGWYMIPTMIYAFVVLSVLLPRLRIGRKPA